MNNYRVVSFFYKIIGITFRKLVVHNYAFTGKIMQDMDNPEYFKQSLEEVQNMVIYNSFFRDTPHYRVTASLPLA